MDNILDRARQLAPDRDMNVVVIKGTVSAPPDLRTYESGATKLHLMVTARTFEPERHTYVIPVDLWDPPAEAVATVHHHARVWVVGYVRRHFFPQDEGRRSVVQIIARHVEVDDAEGEAAEGEPEAGAAPAVAAAT